MLLDGPTQSTRIPNSGAMQAQGYIVVHLLIIYCQFGAILALPKVHKSLIQEPCQHKGILPCIYLLYIVTTMHLIFSQFCWSREEYFCILGPIYDPRGGKVLNFTMEIPLFV